MKMGRVYHLSKKETQEELNEIVREMRELEDIQKVEIVEGGAYMKVITVDDCFETVMNQAVNICKRVSDGLSLSFARFI